MATQAEIAQWLGISQQNAGGVLSKLALDWKNEPLQSVVAA